MVNSITIPLTPTTPPAQSVASIPHTGRTTAADATSWLADWLGMTKTISADGVRACKRCVQAALRILTDSANWTYLYQHGRVFINGHFTVGTVQLQLTAGAQPNYATFTFPGLTVQGASNASPIVITSAGHGLSTNTPVTISGVLGNTAANGSFTITAIDQNTFSLNGSTGNGAYTSGGTVTPGLPNWATLGTCLRIGTVVYDVKSRVDSTHLIIQSDLTAVADVPAGSGFDLYQDAYDLPEDMVALDKIQPDTIWAGMEYVHPSAWLETVRSMQSLSNTPRWFTVMGSTRTPGRLAIRIFPYPDTSKTLDFVYKRRPRKISQFDYSTGTVTIDAINTPTTVAGTGTAWTSDMVGSVIRFSATSTLPTGLEDTNPFVFERNIQAVVSATQITLDQAAPVSLVAKGYRVSDPIDVDDGSMLDAFYRCAEWQMGIVRKDKTLPQLSQAWVQALMKAREADSRFMGQRVAGLGGPFRQRLARMPRGPDIS